MQYSESKIAEFTKKEVEETLREKFNLGKDVEIVIAQSGLENFNEIIDKMKKLERAGKYPTPWKPPFDITCMVLHRKEKGMTTP